MNQVRTNLCGTDITHPNKNITAIKYKQQYEVPSEDVKYSAALPNQTGALSEGLMKTDQNNTLLNKSSSKYIVYSKRRI